MNNLVTLNKNNQPTTTSKQIADVFEKEHKNILSAINSLDIPDNFRGLNFKLSKYQSQNRNGQMLPCYEITRDGFTLLAMGFTGKKAMEWKIKYIEAFNAMEKALREQNNAVALPEQYAPVDMKAIGGVVKKCVAVAVRDELSKLLSGDKTDNWEVSDKDLIYYLYNWHLTKNKKDAEMFRKLNATVDRLMAENAGLKEAIKNTKAVLRNW